MRQHLRCWLLQFNPGAPSPPLPPPDQHCDRTPILPCHFILPAVCVCVSMPERVCRSQFYQMYASGRVAVQRDNATTKCNNTATMQHPVTIAALR